MLRTQIFNILEQAKTPFGIYCRINEALWMPLVWSWARKILTVDCHLTYLKALTQHMASLPLGQSLKNSTLDEISTSICSQSLDETFQSKFFIKKDLLRGWCQQRGSNPYIFVLKGRTKSTSHQLQAPFDDQSWNEMKFNQLYESTCVGFWRFP